MMDANQRWDVPEAVEWMAKLAEFKPLWIEEPTSPDDILGHATISKVKNLLLLLEWWSQILRLLGLFPFTVLFILEKLNCYQLKGYQQSKGYNRPDSHTL